MSDVRITLSKDTFCSERIGISRLTKLSFDGVDLRPLWHELMEKVTDDEEGAGLGLDLSLIAQLLGDKKTGLAIQKEVLSYQRQFRSPCATTTPRLKLLALAAATDIGGNTPVEFLLEGSDIALITLYVVPGLPLLQPLPDHDVAMVTVCESKETRETLAEIDRLLPHWPRPVLNTPGRLSMLDRDRLWPLLSGIPGLVAPITNLVSRDDLARIGADPEALRAVLPDADFPLVVRPLDSHAGFGLEKLDRPDAIAAYLTARGEESFFLSRFVDYAGADGLFRKYRVVAVDGRAYACHMAISEQWKIWYLNADMTINAARRAEEARFMEAFDEEFGRRHARALEEMIARIGLDYTTIDCGETPAGELLVFEADSAAIVHNMDPPSVFPYKAPQMHKIFRAFTDMISARAGKARQRAA